MISARRDAADVHRRRGAYCLRWLASPPCRSSRWALTLPFTGVRARGPRAARAPRRGARATTTSGPARPTGPTASRRWRSPPRGPSEMRLGTGVVNPFTRGIPVLAQHAAALADAVGRALLPRARLVVERDRRALERRAVHQAADARARGGRGAAPDPRRRARARRLQARDRAGARPCRSYVAALRDRMLRLGGELGDGTFVNFLPLSALPHVTEQIRAGERPPAAARARARSCAASSASRSRPRRAWARALPALGLRDRARLRGVLPLARLGRRARPDGRGVARGRPQARARARARGADPRDRHLRLARRSSARGSTSSSAGGITTPVLTFLSAPEQLPSLIDALAP